MSSCIFNVNGVDVVIQCKEEETMENICKNLASKTGIDINMVIVILLILLFIDAQDVNRLPALVHCKEVENRIDRVLFFTEQNDGPMPGLRQGQRSQVSIGRIAEMLVDYRRNTTEPSDTVNIAACRLDGQRTALERIKKGLCGIGVNTCLFLQVGHLLCLADAVNHRFIIGNIMLLATTRNRGQHQTKKAVYCYFSHNEGKGNKKNRIFAA